MSRKALLGLVLLGWALRIAPVLSYPLDYDEGVHYAAAALWLKGVWPYRDFVFVHPPGILYVLAPFTLCPPPLGLLLARLAVSLVGALNIALVASLSSRSFGSRAGYLSALCYAVYPEAAASERRILLEPVLNCLILSMLLSSRGRAAWWAGCALCVKVWAGLWLVTSLPRLRGYGLLALGVCLLLCLPFLQGAFWQDTVLFHLHRPAHAAYVGWVRLLDIFDARHLAVSLLALLGWWRWREPTALTRQMAWSWGLLLLALALAPAHFFQYNAHLAVPECYWAGAAWRMVTGRPRLAAVWLCVPLGFVLAGWLKSDPAAWQRAQRIRQWIDPAESLFCFEPGYGLLAGRLPDSGREAPVVVDSYATMLMDAGPGFDLVVEAMASPRAQTRVRQRLRVSDWVVVEERAHEQMSGTWLEEHFRPRYGDLWHAR